MSLACKVGTQNSSPTSDGVKLVVFDFDQTLSVIHVFKALAGWSRDVQVPKPHATTERGQVHRVAEISQVEPFRSEGGFANAAFGGEGRVEQIRQLLERLRARDVELVICTKGLVGTVRKCLSDIGLLGFFSEVYGNVGDNYGETSYDKELARSKPTSQELQFMSRPDKAAWKSKDKLIQQLSLRAGLSREQADRDNDKLIQQLSLRAGLSREQAVLVEDDAEEIRRATPICRTLWVKEASGMTTRHCTALLQMAEGGSAGSRMAMAGGGGFGEEPPRASRSDSRPLRPNMEVRHREHANATSSDGRRHEEAPASVNSSGRQEFEGSVLQDMSRLSLEDDCRPRRARSSADVAKARRSSRPASRGSRSTLQAAAAKMLATAVD